MKKTVFLLLTLLSTLHLLAVDVTFRVDMSLHTVSPDGVHIAGSFNGWEPAATLMTNSGNSIYTVVLSLTPASVYEYKFINGNAWGADELVPAECGVPNGSGGYNRQMTAPGTATELEAVCFGLCNACGPQVTLTLQVDMSQQTVSAEGVHVAGTFNNWNSMATAMTGTGNGIYTATVTVLDGTMQEYKYINGNAWSGEEFVPAECGVPNGMGGYNRIQYVAYNNFTREPECFGQCSACAILPHNIQGTVLYNNAAATPIDNVIVSLRQNNLIISTTTTDPNGVFLFTNLFPGTYNFSLSTSKPWGGLDASDANKVLSHAAQQEILTVPVRLKAADVNNSGTINALDAAKIYSGLMEPHRLLPAVTGFLP
jgi:hypothetical protein